jgi:hypothetical protein
MTQPGQTGRTSTDNDGFGPTRLERGAQKVAPTAPPAGAPLVTGRAAPSAKPAPAPASVAPPAPAPVSAPPAKGAPAEVKADTPTTAVPSVAPKAAPAPKAAAAKAPAAKVPAAKAGRGPRRARLQLRNVNAWTVFKFSCVLSVFLFLVWLIVVMLLFGVLNASGVIGDINRSVTTINGPGSSGVVNGGRVFGYALIIGAVNAVLFIALSTVGSVVYNLCADLVGGVEVTLSERES